MPKILLKESTRPDFIKIESESHTNTTNHTYLIKSKLLMYSIKRGDERPRNPTTRQGWWGLALLGACRSAKLMLPYPALVRHKGGYLDYGADARSHYSISTIEHK